MKPNDLISNQQEFVKMVMASTEYKKYRNRIITQHMSTQKKMALLKEAYSEAEKIFKRKHKILS